MNKLHLAIAFILLIAFSSNTKAFSKEFKQNDREVPTSAQYSNDEAEAIVLFDKAKSYFVQREGAFDIVFERTTRIKVNTASGIKWATVEIPVYHEGDISEYVQNIKASSFNDNNGQIVETQIDKSDIIDENIDEQWDVTKFTIPNVKEGSTIEYSYKIYTKHLYKSRTWDYQYKIPVDYSEYDANSIRDWEFQWKIPVVYSEYEAHMIPFYEYTFLLQGAKKFDSQTSYIDKSITRQLGVLNFQDLVYKFTMKDLPAFNSEAFITSINDYIIKIDFQLSKIKYPNGGSVDIMTTWEKMVGELAKHSDFGKYITKSEKLASKQIDLKHIDSFTEKEKFNYVLDFVKNNYSWDNQNGKYASKSANKFIEEKIGNCADINLFTIGLLKAAGINAKPVVISTREHGKIKYDYPYTQFFNYVIIMANVDGENVLSDATDILILNNRIPSRCINDKGLIIEEDKTVWIGLECLFPSVIETDIKIDISDNESINSSISKTATEYDALVYRKSMDNEEKVKNELNVMYDDIIESSISIQNQLNKEKPYILSYNLSSKAEIINEKIYISPFLNELISETPLKENERTYPVDLTYPKKRVFHSSISVPAGYQIVSVPEEKKLKTQLYELSYTAKNVGNLIELTFEYSFNSTVYPPEQYADVKYFFNEIVQKGKEQIVLKKK